MCLNSNLLLNVISWRVFKKPKVQKDQQQQKKKWTDYAQLDFRHSATDWREVYCYETQEVTHKHDQTALWRDSSGFSSTWGLVKKLKNVNLTCIKQLLRFSLSINSYLFVLEVWPKRMSPSTNNCSMSKKMSSIYDASLCITIQYEHDSLKLYEISNAEKNYKTFFDGGSPLWPWLL